MKILNGIDLVEIKRIKNSIETYQQRFLNRIFTAAEQALCDDNFASLAARFAGKEAVSKVFKTGIGKIQWTDIEILRDECGAPTLTLYAEAQKKADELNIIDWSISLSHTKDHAIAMVTVISD